MVQTNQIKLLNVLGVQVPRMGAAKSGRGIHAKGSHPVKREARTPDTGTPWRAWTETNRGTKSRRPGAGAQRRTTTGRLLCSDRDTWGGKSRTV